MPKTLDLLEIPKDQIIALCRRYDVTRLSLFGSVLTSDFTSQSDVDILVSFAPEAKVSFFTLSRMQRELSELLGRSVDLVPADGLKPLIRDGVITGSRVIYEA